MASILKVLSGSQWVDIPALIGPKGDKGDTGSTGATGPAPVRGIDYWTASDKAEVVNDAINGVSPSSIGAIANPSTKASGQYLKYNGSAWIADDVSGGVNSVDGKTGAVVTRLLFTNQEIPSSAWTEQSEPTYEDFPYVASLALTGVTANDFADVVLSVTDALSGEFAPVVETYSGGLYLYRDSAAESTVTIPSICIIKGATS